MDHLALFTDLEKLKREITYSLDSTWGTTRYFFAGDLSNTIRRVKKEYRVNFGACIPAYRAVTTQLRSDCTLAFQAQVLPELPIGNFGRCITSFAFVSLLLDRWENYNTAFTRAQKVEALVVPLWQKIVNKVMELKFMSSYRTRSSNLTMFREMMLRSDLELLNPAMMMEDDPDATLPCNNPLRNVIDLQLEMEERARQEAVEQDEEEDMAELIS